MSAVIFDWGGTLTPWHQVDLEEQWRVFVRQIEDVEERVAYRAAAIIAAEDAAWKRSREHHTSARLHEILAEAGLAPHEIEHAAARSAYEQFWDPHTFTDPQVKPLWTALRDKGIRVGVLSNTIWDRDRHRAIFERDGVADLIDADVYSSEIEHAKPHAGAFRAACDAVGVAPAEAVYVGDRRYEDVHGPHQIGMRAIWVPHSDIPAYQHIETGDQPDGVAHQLLDVLTIVEQWR